MYLYKLKLKTCSHTAKCILLLWELHHTRGENIGHLWASQALPVSSSSESDSYSLYNNDANITLLICFSEASFRRSLLVCVRYDVHTLLNFCLAGEKNNEMDKTGTASGAVQCWNHIKSPQGALSFLRITSDRKKQTYNGKKNSYVVVASPLQCDMGWLIEMQSSSNTLAC